MEWNRTQRIGKARRTPFVASVILGTLTLHLLCGCESSQDISPMADSCYLNQDKDLGSLGRVALVELESLPQHPGISGEVTQALYVAIQKKQTFGITLIRKDDPGWPDLQEGIDSFQALRRLAAIRKTLQCGGLLVGTITQYQPYPHMTIGLRLKLLDLTDGQLLWGCEQVWDCADGNLQKRIAAYLKGETRSGAAPRREELVTMSTINFAKFVAYEIGETFEPLGK